MQWKTEKRKLKELRQFEGNPRGATDKQRKALDHSLDKFNLASPLVVNTDGEIIGGNFRYRCLLEKHGEDYEIDVRIPEEKLDREQAKELNLRLNKNQGEWDDELLAEFGGEDLLSEVGFDSGELDDLFAVEEETDEGLPEVSKESRTERGDIYQLGEHRVMCGDGTKREDVKRLMDGQKAEMAFTSPPYWVGFDYEEEDKKETILQHIQESAEVMAEFVTDKIVINTGNISSITKAEKITGKKQPALLIDWWKDALNDNNFLLRHVRIWAKAGGVTPNRGIDKIDMHWEYIGTFTLEEGNAGFIATFWQSEAEPEQQRNTPEWAVNGVWTDIQGEARQSEHVAAFPVKIPKRYLMMYLERGGLLYEPYLGSGTSLIACESMNRKCYGMELNPKYVDVTIERWENYTGNKAKRT